MSLSQPYAITDFEPGPHYSGKLLEPGWKVTLMHSCMDDVLAECNFKVFLKSLGGESETIRIERVGFSGDGWYEFIAINSTNQVAMDQAKGMLDKLLDYPILDDDAFTEAEEEYYTSIGYVQSASGEWEPAVETESMSPSPA